MVVSQGGRCFLEFFLASSEVFQSAVDMVELAKGFGCQYKGCHSNGEVYTMRHESLLECTVVVFHSVFQFKIKRCVNV